MRIYSRRLKDIIRVMRSYDATSLYFSANAEGTTLEVDVGDRVLRELRPHLSDKDLLDTLAETIDLSVSNISNVKETVDGVEENMLFSYEYDTHDNTERGTLCRIW